MTDTLSDKLRQMVARNDDELDALWEAADEIEQLTAERDEARRGDHRENEHMPTWAELTAYWKARAEELEAALQVAEKGLATALTWSDGDETWVAHDAVVKARNAARAALGENKPLEDRWDNA